MKSIGHNDEITPGDWHRTRINELKAIEIEAALSVPINGNSNATNGPQDNIVIDYALYQKNSSSRSLIEMATPSFR